MATSDADLSCVLSVYSLLATLHIVPSGCIKASKDSVISLIPEMMIKRAEHGVYFCLEQPLRAKLPLLGKFKAIDNVIFLAAQERPMGTYLWGVPVDPLLNWTPPKGTALIEEDKLFWSAKLPHADVAELAEIENTVTHPQLRAMVDKFISHCPTFKSAGIRSISDPQVRADLGYVKTITKAVVLGEQGARKAAAQKATTSKERERHGLMNAVDQWVPEVDACFYQTHEIFSWVHDDLTLHPMRIWAVVWATTK